LLRRLVFGDRSKAVTIWVLIWKPRPSCPPMGGRHNNDLQEPLRSLYARPPSLPPPTNPWRSCTAFLEPPRKGVGPLRQEAQSQPCPHGGEMVCGARSSNDGGPWGPHPNGSHFRPPGEGVGVAFRGEQIDAASVRASARKRAATVKPSRPDPSARLGPAE
jgi:hypothetical protein